jgi:uncharacterized repeat protein (TIGR03803 family)
MKLKNIWRAVGTSLLLGLTPPLSAQVFTLQHNFTNTPDGANPGPLVGVNGLFFGTTEDGGTNAFGMIYGFDPNGAGFFPIYSFTGATNNGDSPNNVLATGNVFYGTTEFGGITNVGMIFAVNTNGTGFNSLYTFGPPPDGHYPVAGLVLGGATLYGTANTGGTNGGGTLFKINTDGTGYKILHWFTNTPDGSSPQSELLLSGSTLYGTTAFGGTGNGTVFSINTNGTGYTILRSFTNAPDGNYPYGGLILNSGFLYGTTGGGGSNITGTIFALSTNGSVFNILHHFAGSAANTEGWLPRDTLMFSGGNLYGTTGVGGTGGQGTVFQINTNGSGYTVLKSFTNNAGDGADPLDGVVLLGTTLWGTTYSGGTGYGTFYSLQLSPAIIQQPYVLTVTNGNPATFTNVASGAAPLFYQWYFNTNTPVGGGTNAILVIAAATTNQAGYYSVIVTNNYGRATSSVAQLTVIVVSQAPVITLQPQSVNATNGNPVTLTTAAQGSGVLSYQWYLNTNTAVAGGTSPSLLFTNVILSQAGYYLAIVTNTYGRATSSVAQLTVASVPNIYSIVRNSDASMTLGLADLPNSRNSLLLGTNLLQPLASWKVIFNGRVNATTGLLQVNDTNAIGSPKLFYRLSSP